MVSQEKEKEKNIVSGKKRKLLGTIVFFGSLFFGRLNLDRLKSSSELFSNYGSAKNPVHEQIIQTSEALTLRGGENPFGKGLTPSLPTASSPKSPSSIRQPSNFPTGGRIPHLNPYRYRATVNQGLGAGGGGAGGGGAGGGGGGGGGAAKFDNQCPVPKKPKLPKSKTLHYDYLSNSQKKKKAKKKEYSQIMDELENQKNQKYVEVEIDGKTFTIKNPYPYKTDVYELEEKLANLLYAEFRKNDKDVAIIAKKNYMDIKVVQKCKDHIFHKKHVLDKFVKLGQAAEYRRFDPNLQQALAWKRFKDGIPTKADYEWFRHEREEQKYESKNKKAGYEACHNFAQNLYNGNPWKKWDNPS